MNCLTHETIPALAVCTHCGRGLCAQCLTRSASGRYVCSPVCAAAVGLQEQAMSAIRDKTITSARVTGYFSLILGILFGGVAIFVAWQGLRGLAAFVVPTALVFIVTGIAFLRIAKRKEQGG